MKKLTLSTSEGRWRLLALFAALIILFSACGNAVITGGYKFNCKTVTLDVQGASFPSSSMSQGISAVIPAFPALSCFTAALRAFPLQAWWHGNLRAEVLLC